MMRSGRITREMVERSLTVMDLDEAATVAEIKAAYRSLAMRYHPDRCSDEDARRCHERMVEINAAYRLLLTHRGDSSPSPEKAQEAHEYEEWWWRHFGEGPV